MKTKNKTFGKELLHAVMMIILMGWTNTAWAERDPIVAKWDFKNGNYEDLEIKGKTAQLDAMDMTPTNTTPLSLFIDASGGKFVIQNKKRSVLNKGTKLHIPVVSTKDEIEMQVNDNNDRPMEYFEIGENQISGLPVSNNIATVTYKAKKEDVERGYVIVEAVGAPKKNDPTAMSNNSYIYYISVTQYPPVYEEKCLYSTDFQDWNKVTAQIPAVNVSKKTVDGQDLVFELYNIYVDPSGEKTSKFTNDCITKGYLYAKEGTTDDGYYFETSVLKDVTSVKFVQAATGGAKVRGWGVKALVDGETEWKDIYTTGIANTKGESLSLDVNLKKVKLRFYKLDKDKTAYMTSIEIYGNVEVKEDVNITYYDTDGTTVLDKETVSASEPLTFKEGIENMVTVPSGQKFRGWFDGTRADSEKVLEGSELSVDLSLFAKATPIEEATNGSYYEYDMTKRNFYQEDHELIEIAGGVWHDNKHGWSFSKGGTIRLQVAGKAHIDMTLCSEGKGGTISVTDESGDAVSSFDAKAATDATVQGIDYTGETPTTLNISIPAGTYIHGLNLFNYVPVYLTFDCSDKNIQGTGPDAILCEALTGKATMPNHTLLYRKGWTFKGWTDGINVYKSGQEYVFTKSVTLKPKMEANDIDLTDTYTPIEVVWPFDHREAPVINITSSSKEKTLPYTKTVKVEGEEYDVTMVIDATNGKIVNNDSRINDLNNGSKGAQINNKTQFTIPAVYGMTVTIHASDKIDGTSSNNETFFGKDPANDAIIQISDANGYSLKNGTDNENISVSSDYKTLTFTYKGDAKEAVIFIEKSGSNDQWGFYNDITVTYPVLPSIDLMYIISNMNSDKFPNERPINAGKATVTLKNTEASRDNIGIRYKEGDVVNINVKPDYGYEFDNLTINGTTYQSDNFDYTVVSGNNSVVVSFMRKELHRVTVKSSDITLGTVSLSPKYDNFYQETRNEDGRLVQVESWFEEGTEVNATASAMRNYMLNYWAEDGNNVSNTNPYPFTTGAADKTLIAHFTLGNKGTVIFKIPEGTVNAASDNYKGSYSITPDEQRNVRSFAIPTNYTFYKNDDAASYGSTLQYWKAEGTEGDNHFVPGQLYSFKTPGETLTLIPVFKTNPASYTNRMSNAVLRFDFAREIQEYNDPDLNMRRNVCAQEVNIGKNEKPFWTAQAHITVMEGGENNDHDRDVALWCDTGSKGYIRNTDLDNWCAFGPGTTLWVPAGTGTKISMLTYAKITTTTFDGVVPTLDEERTQQEREKAGSDKMYVYTYTTTSSADRVAICIGDDYSYYKWLELNIQPANLVSMHTTVDSEGRGVVSKIESVSGTEVKELEDGGYAFHQGDRVRLTLNRKFGYKLDKIVDPAKTDANGEPLAVLRMNYDDGTVDMVGLGDVSTTSKVSKNADGSWGDADNTVFLLREVAPTAQETADSLRTRYEIEFNITTHRTFEVYFKEKDTYYITYNAGELATGTAPEAAWLEEGDTYTIPRNQTLYYEGNTLDHWRDDAGGTYIIGNDYKATTTDLRLFPVFVPNPFNILDLTEDCTATWYLDKEEGAPTINYEGTAGILVTQLTNKAGESIDMKVRLDATQGGKFNNTDANRTERIQINGKSIIEIPVTPKCVVKWVATQDISQLSIAGKVVTPTGTQKREVEAECVGDKSIDQILFLDGIYSKNFSITYKPQTATKATIESLTCNGETYTAEQIAAQMAADNHVTFHVSPWETDEKIPAVTGTATENGTVTATEATIYAKACVATVRTASGIIVETYPIEFVFNTPEAGNTPQFVKITVNGTDYTETSNEIYDVPQSGLIRVEFNRTMEATTITSPEYNITSTAKSAKTLEFKYWDVPKGGTVVLNIPHEAGLFKDIYGMSCQQDLNLTLHIIDDKDYYHHHQFDFVVGIDGDMDEAIRAANGEATDKIYNNTKENNHRYFVFVPDGKYELTGNSTISCPTTGDLVPKDEAGKVRPDMNGQNNHMTIVKKPNVSIVGQSKDGTMIYNHPIVEGISYAATLNTDKTATDFYAEDLTLENRFNYFGSMSGQGTGGAGRAAAFLDRGNRTIMKSIALKSWQDTYYSSNANSDYRGYFESSDLYGVVDWLCGNGNIWYEKCNIIVRDRTGNNIAAPSTEETQDFGYVFNNCTIKPEDENPTQLKGNDWTLARPWNKSPACTFLNTRMYTQPRTYGWNKMTTELVVRFHEYRSMDGAGNLLSLGTRSLAACSPAPGSDDCILSDELAENYTIRNAMGGPDAFEPNELCKQIDATSATEADMDENHELWDDQIELDDDNLIWQAQPSALCYFVFKLEEKTGKWIYKENTTDTSVNITGYGSGYYNVRAANQMGGLGAATDTIHFELQDPYELEIKQTGDLTVDGTPYGWSTICLPFNAKVPQDVTVYAATAHDKTTDDEKVTDLTMTLTPVTVIDKEKGYVVYGPVGIHPFNPTSRSCTNPTILTGNPTKNDISATNINCYVLANKTWGLGFYKFTGTMLKAYRAWLPQDMVSTSGQSALATGTKAIRFTFASDTSIPSYPIHGDDDSDEEIEEPIKDTLYTTSGQRIESANQQGIYISKRNGKFAKK